MKIVIKRTYCVGSLSIIEADIDGRHVEFVSRKSIADAEALVERCRGY